MAEILTRHAIQPIVKRLKRGEVLIFATDTVWGLGGNALDSAVTQRVIQIKNKPADAKLIWLFPSVTAVKKHFGTLSPTEIKLLNQKRTTVIVHGQGVRVVKNGWLNKLLARAGVPVIATSANLHGEPVVTSWRQAEQLFGTKVDAIIKGRKIYRALPSTVCTVGADGQTQIIRQGGGIYIK